MKRTLLVLLAGLLTLTACTLPGLTPDPPTITPGPSPTQTTPPTLTPIPSPTLTPTPTLSPGDKALANGDYFHAQDEYQIALASYSDEDIRAQALFGLGKTHFLYENYLPEMICVVINYEQSLSQDRLPTSPWYFGEKVNTLVRDEVTHFLKIAEDLSYRFIPFVIRSVFLWPVIVRPFHLFVVLISAKIQNIPLSDPDMLKQLPRRVRRPVPLVIDLIERKIFQSRFYIDMSRLSLKQFQYVFT
jgi:hypothetical protein